MALTDFGSNQTRSALDISWNFGFMSGKHGIIIPVSAGVTSAQTVTTRMGWTIFYIKT